MLETGTAGSHRLGAQGRKLIKGYRANTKKGTNNAASGCINRIAQYLTPKMSEEDDFIHEKRCMINHSYVVSYHPFVVMRCNRGGLPWYSSCEDESTMAEAHPSVYYHLFAISITQTAIPIINPERYSHVAMPPCIHKYIDPYQRGKEHAC